MKPRSRFSPSLLQDKDKRKRQVTIRMVQYYLKQGISEVRWPKMNDGYYNGSGLPDL